jgi:transposase
MKTKTSRYRLDVDVEELDRVIDATENGPLSKADRQKLKTTLHALVERLARKRNTEKTSAVLEPKTPPAANAPEVQKPEPAGHGRNGAAAFTGANRTAVPHDTLHSGDACPGCGEGKVYRQKEPATLIRIIGQAPLKATVYEMERLRCNACGEVFTASPPQSAGAEKFDTTAVAMIALLKYGAGMPFNGWSGSRHNWVCRWRRAVGVDGGGAKPAQAVLDELIRFAAQGGVMHNDDTSMRVLKLVRADDGRTGVFTSGIVSISGGWKVALYFTGWKHAGENLADVMKRRAAELDAPIQMCDALSRNTPKLPGVEVLLANCLAHGRRQVVDVAANFPEQSRYVLESLGAIYSFDAEAKQRDLTPE